MNKLNKAIKYAKKSLRLAKSYKKDRDQEPNDYILLFAVDIWNTVGQKGVPNVINYKYQARYFVLSYDDLESFDSHDFYMIDNPTYPEVLSDKDYHFTKSFAEQMGEQYRKFLSSNVNLMYTLTPKLMSLPDFKSRFGSK